MQSADNRLSLRQLRLGDAVGRGEIEVLAGLAAGDKVVRSRRARKNRRST